MVGLDVVGRSSVCGVVPDAANDVVAVAGCVGVATVGAATAAVEIRRGLPSDSMGQRRRLGGTGCNR
jgi:Zn-dependent alcohol dehydrogenase